MPAPHRWTTFPAWLSDGLLGMEESGSWQLPTMNDLSRLLHHPTLYKKIHKKHHEWTAPIGVISVYAHPIEHVVSISL